MNKNIITAFSVFCALTIVSCDTPKDLRPGEKVSVDTIEPGTRFTHNVGKNNVIHGESHKDEVLLNHDPGANETLQKGDSIRETEETNSELGIQNR
jgi:aspartate 1-decarboxylase